jgi:SagB-type dehydrogenase family enzyme
MGYLDWATQPDPFRRFTGAHLVELPREATAATVPYHALFDGSVPPGAMTDTAVAEFLRCSMGLSAWKEYRTSRWALRVNPSSGNLHPTEAYIVRDGLVAHYAPHDHALEQRTSFGDESWHRFADGREGFLVALTSIHWREAWKYGERAFRYCQHDAGHAIAALRLAGALLGWRVSLLTRWADAEIATVLGLDREEDFAGAEHEEPECVAVVSPADPAAWIEADPSALVEAARRATWHGVANQLSPSRVEWPAIDTVAAATRYVGTRDPGTGGLGLGIRSSPEPRVPSPEARTIILQRRSALGFDARSTLPRQVFMSMLARLRPASPPWDAIDWPPHVHLLLFVHRVEGLTPGLYAFLRDPGVAAEWQSAMRPEFLWERINLPNDPNDLFLLVPTDVTWVANRLSCDQDIAADGFFSLAMIARLESALRERGEWFYRRLFWESGLIGQVLYLEAEAAGARATGIGCFYDDPVHEMAGLSGHEWQSLYHFSMGVPVDDGRLTTEPGYPWEQAKRG